MRSRVISIIIFQEKKNNLDLKYFLDIKKVLEYFNQYKMNILPSQDIKLKIKAINGLKIENIEYYMNPDNQKELQILYNHAELIRQYPRAKKLQDIVPYLTIEKLKKIIPELTEKACEKLLYNPIKFDSFSTYKLNLICDKLNLSVYLFFE